MRRFHFAPGLRAEASAGAITAGGDGDFAVTLADCSADVDIEQAISRAVDEPRPLGWIYPGDRERVPVCVAELRSRAREATYVATLAPGPARLMVAAAHLDRRGADLRLPSAAAGRLLVHIEGRCARVSAVT